jgi:hypothetical protein
MKSPNRGFLPICVLKRRIGKMHVFPGSSPPRTFQTPGNFPNRTALEHAVVVSPHRGETTGQGGQVPSRTPELARNLPNANHLNTPAGDSAAARTLVAGPALPAGSSRDRSASRSCHSLIRRPGESAARPVRWVHPSSAGTPTSLYAARSGGWTQRTSRDSGLGVGWPSLSPYPGRFHRTGGSSPLGYFLESLPIEAPCSNPLCGQCN